MSDQEQTTQEPKSPRKFSEILSDLEKPIPSRFIKTKTLKGNRINFSPWYQTQRLLDYYTNGFWEVDVDVHVGDSTTTAVVRLTVISSDMGRVTRTSTGCEDAEVSAYGDTTSNAEAQAFKRACARFGLGLHLYYDK